jgi:hypothetical protein
MNYRIFGFLTFAVMPIVLCVVAQANEPALDENVDEIKMEYLPSSLAADPSSFTSQGKLRLLIEIEQAEAGTVEDVIDISDENSKDAQLDRPEPPRMATVIFLSCASIIFIKK